MYNEEPRERRPLGVVLGRAVIGVALWFVLFWVLPVAIVWIGGGPK